MWFAEKKADLTVMEVGMGGRFDATNVTNPVVSVITTVTLDHTRYLGDTREAIAREKVQIVPRGGILVAGRMGPDVSRVLTGHVREAGAEMLLLGRDFDGAREGRGGPGTANDMRYHGRSFDIDGLHLPLAGLHQIDNAAVALAVIEVLGQKGFSIPEDSVRQGIGTVRIPGRIEKILENPEVIVDVAHNPDSAVALTDHIQTLPKKKTAFVVGMMADKDIAGFLRGIDAAADILVLTQPRVARAATVQTLADMVGYRQRPTRIIRGVRESLDWAKAAVGTDGRVVVTGSFYTVQEAVEGLNASP
jgi:dihydrofolate synthase/folylpolyglutamate synthase